MSGFTSPGVESRLRDYEGVLAKAHQFGCGRLRYAIELALNLSMDPAARATLVGALARDSDDA